MTAVPRHPDCVCCGPCNFRLCGKAYPLVKVRVAWSCTFRMYRDGPGGIPIECESATLGDVKEGVLPAATQNPLIDPSGCCVSPYTWFGSSETLFVHVRHPFFPFPCLPTYVELGGTYTLGDCTGNYGFNASFSFPGVGGFAPVCSLPVSETQSGTGGLGPWILEWTCTVTLYKD